MAFWLLICCQSCTVRVSVFVLGESALSASSSSASSSSVSASSAFSAGSSSSTGTSTFSVLDTWR